MTLAVRLTLILLVASLSWIYGGPGGIVTLVLFVLGVWPGVSIGTSLFGKTHAARWAAGQAPGLYSMADVLGLSRG